MWVQVKLQEKNLISSLNLMLITLAEWLPLSVNRSQLTTHHVHNEMTTDCTLLC